MSQDQITAIAAFANRLIPWPSQPSFVHAVRDFRIAKRKEQKRWAKKRKAGKPHALGGRPISSLKSAGATLPRSG